MRISEPYSEYVIFADESGDHGLVSLNPENPMFVLTFCIFKKRDYISIVKESVAQFKFDFWGHDLAILHNHDIRKSKGDFLFLFDEEIRMVFLNSLNELVKRLPFSIIAAAIDKRRLVDTQTNPGNPYLLALGFCLERVSSFLAEKNQNHALTHIVVESRGRVEDKDLEFAFREYCTQSRMLGDGCLLDMKFANKKTNNCGLQIADLVAHPIARWAARREQPNKAFEKD